MRSLAVVVGTGLILLSGCGPGPAPDAGSTASNPSRQDTERSRELFVDATTELGVEFIHDSGATGRFAMWEQIGSGGALFDFDNDGLLDLYLVQCGGNQSPSFNRLFHQEKDGRFRDVTEASGLGIAGLGMGAIAGDVNNDGRADLVVTEYGGTRLFLNGAGGQFTEVTAAAGIDNPRWATSASFLDYDRDGWLDLVVVNYLDYDPARDCRDHTGQPEYCGPQDFPGTVSKLFHNLGPGPDGTPAFEDVTVRSGLALASGPGLGVLVADFDGNRWPDIFIADDGKPNRLFISRGDGTFAEEAAMRGIALNAMGSTAGNMGVAAGDVDENGLFDVFVTHLTHEQHSFWVQEPQGLFQDRIAALGLVNPRWRGTGFGAVLADFNLDGTLDLAFLNGRVLRGSDPGARLPGLLAAWHPYAQRPQLFLNAGSAKFDEVSESNPALCAHAAVGRSLMMGDLDNDGDPDLIATTVGGPVRLFRNVASSTQSWLTLRTVDPRLGGRDAIGAEVRVVAGGRTYWRLAQPGMSFLASHDPRAFIGLGSVRSVDSIHVRWPDGADETFPGTEASRHLVLRRGEGSLASANP